MNDKLDLFSILTRLDLNDMRFFEETKKGDPLGLEVINKNITWMIPQWFTVAESDKDHRFLVECFNEYANPGWFSLYGKPELQYKMLAAFGVGHRTRHKFIKPSPKKEAPLKVLLQVAYPDIRDDEISLWKTTIGLERAIELAISMGYHKEKLDEIRGEFT